MPFSIYNDDIHYSPLTFSEVFWDEQSFNDKIMVIGGTAELTGLYDILALKYATAITRYYMEEAFVMAIRRNLAIAWPAYKKQKELQDQIYNLTLEDINTQLATLRLGNKANTGQETSTDTGSYSDTKASEGNTANSGNVLTNVIDSNNSPVVNANTVAIKNKSNRQQNVNQDTQTDINSTSSAAGSTNRTGAKEASINEDYTESIQQLGNKLEALNNQYEVMSRDYQEQIYRKVDSLFKVIL